MKADFSRSTFDPKKQYTTVRMQQGRMQLDADWNEQMDILVHLLRAQARDLLGSYGAPVASAGFAVTPAQSSSDKPDLHIGAGRYYVDGILVENAHDTLFSAQPYWPHASLDDVAASADRFVAYLDVWERHLTAAEAPSILEPALEGRDTTTRTQTVWQVRLWPAPAAGSGDPPASNQDLLDAWRQWRDETTLPSGRDSLCPRVQPAGYGLTNHLYRVEIHSAGPAVTFKWARDNASDAFAVSSLRQQDNLWTATLEGLPAETRLRAGDVMELADPVFVLTSRPAPLFKVQAPPEWDPVATAVQLAACSALSEQDGQTLHAIGQRLSQDGHPAVDWGRAVLRRWDYNGHTPGTSVASDGALLVQQDQWLPLENGIEVRFADATVLRAGDYWLLPARSETEGYTLLWPVERQPANAPGRPEFAAQPAQRVEHRCAPLAVLSRQDAQWAAADVRTLYSPLAGFEATETSIERRFAATIEALQAEVNRQAEAARIALSNLRDEIELQLASTPSEIYRVADTGAAIEPGQVVALDPATGGIERARRDNAALVVGVAIGPVAHRHAAGQPEQHYRVAQTGRRQCFVTGQVEPGDVLVPSSTPGCATAAGLYIQPGTVIGKALQSHRPADARQCTAIPIIVTLQ